MNKRYNDKFYWHDEKAGIKQEMFSDEDNVMYLNKRTAEVTNHAVTCALSDNRSTVVDDNVYAEAQELVRNWFTNKKVYGDYGDRNSFLRLSSEEHGNGTMKVPALFQIHKEWDHLVDKIESKERLKDEIECLVDSGIIGGNEKAVKSVISNLHKKTFVDKTKLRNIDSPKQVDVMKKMDERQREVRKRKEERLQKEKQEMLEKLAEKEARREAFVMLKEEKRQRELLTKKEEELIQIEMTKIRAELQKQRENEKLERKKLKEAEQLLERQMHNSKDVSGFHNKLSSSTLEMKIKENQSLNHRSSIIQEFIEIKSLNKNHRILQQCFQAWINIVLVSRCKMERAIIWADWQMLRRYFRAWSQYSKSIRLSKLIEIDHLRMIELRRKESVAISFWKRKLLKKCLIHWSLFVIDEKELRWCQKLEEMRKRKMAAYIETLNQKAQENQKKLESLFITHSTNNNVESDLQEPNENFSESHTNRVDQRESTYESLTDRNDRKAFQNQRNNSSCSSAREKSLKMPKQAWQITRKHVDLPLSVLLDDPSRDDNRSNEKNSDSKLMKTFNPFAHRNKAQKEIIDQQQEIIRDQQRKIEEMNNEKLLKKIREPLTKENNDISIPAALSDLQPTTENQSSIAILEWNQYETVQEDKSQPYLKKSQFVLKMEERAKERDKIKAERFERKQQIEEQKRKQLAEQLAEHARIEAEEKLERERIMKEKRAIEKRKQDAKQKRLKSENEKNEKADNLYRMLLMKRYGPQKWYQLITIKKANEVKADNHYRIKLLRLTFVPWLNDCRTECGRQDKIVGKFYTETLLRKCFYHMQLFKFRFDLLESTAHQHYLRSILKRFFIHWRLTNHRQQIRMDKLNEQSVLFYNRCLLKRCFDSWKQLPLASRMDREREKRLESMRQKVASIISDFNPNVHNLN